jgi:hypothetical protein
MAITWKPNLRIDVDPDSRKDFTFDFAEWLPEGRTIVTHEVIASETVTIDQDTREDAEVTFWVSDVPEGATETVTVRITLDTDPVFSDDFSIRFRGRHQ